MKKLFAVVLAVLMLATTGGVVLAGQGNGTPNMGVAYTLNIIGVPAGHEKSADMDCGDGHRIFVYLGGKTGDAVRTDIYLKEGDFAVLDCNGTDDGRAEFQLPKPTLTANPDDPKALGQPGGKVKITTCMEDKGDPTTRYCSTESYVAVSSTGKGAKTYVNVTKELLTVCVCEWVTDHWVCQRVGIFDNVLKDYLWQYDNNGLKHAQLKFYEDPTCYNATGWKCPEPTT